MSKGLVRVLALLSLLAIPAKAWLTKDSVASDRSSVCLMASRGATKWARRQEWLTKRGFALDGASDESSSVPFATIIGNGRIGSTLAREYTYTKTFFFFSLSVFNNQHSAFSVVQKEAGNCVVLGREDEIDADGEGVSSITNSPKV